jgi:DNA-damage-inducible protein J
MTTIQVRIDEKTKTGAHKVFKGLGLDMSSGVKLYLNQVVKDKGLPFIVRGENGYTPGQEQEMIREVEWAKKHAKKYTSVDEIMKDFFPKK